MKKSDDNFQEIMENDDNNYEAIDMRKTADNNKIMEYDANNKKRANYLLTTKKRKEVETKKK